MTAACKDSTVSQIAGAIGLDYSVASVQIDAGTRPNRQAIGASSRPTAKERGAAIGVVKATARHRQAARRLGGKLEAKGFVLVPVSAAVRSQRQS